MSGARSAVGKPLVLIVEDEPSIVELVVYTLQQAGCESVVAGTVAQAWECLLRRPPNLILLDWMLPDHPGLVFLSRMRSDREFSDIPVMLLTAKSTEEDKVAGLDQGADDYVTKPFSPRELSARVKALLRRKTPEHGGAPLVAGALSLNPANCTVTLAGEKLEMGHAEYRLLKFLLANPERVFSRGQLLDRVWGDHVDIEERTVDVHVLRLRKALKDADHLIRTVRSVGYMLSVKS